MTRLKPAAAWASLLVASIVLGQALTAATVPAAILLGPMLCAIAFGVAGSPLRVPRSLFVTAQGVIGCLIAHTVTPTVLRDIAQDWPAMTLGVGLTIGASTAVGWLVARFGTLPGTTAAWGSSPGAASAMVGMAEEHGADARLVAMMQYVRVICVVVTASLVSRFLLGAAPGQTPALPHPAAAPAWAGLGATLAVAFGGAWLGQRLRIPAGGLLAPLAIGAVLNASGTVELVLPWWLLVAAYVVVGWYIGLQFERGIVVRSLRALPEILAASFAVIGLCGASAWLLTRVAGYDALTAFLATSPGGIDSVAIIAVDGGADTAAVMALQTLRVLVVVLTGPWIARRISRAAGRREA